MSEALKSCPFCGGIPRFVDGHDEDGRFVAVACDCGIGTGNHYPIMDDARPNAANEWNRRFLDTQMSEIIELLAPLAQNIKDTLEGLIRIYSPHEDE